ncbi:MAG TPA: hypothetical protein VFV38_28120 [Ktedonobacteraceae bacterium]|nr:hypothetical protein [Ktedonobacteraceae bacterium]
MDIGHITVEGITLPDDSQEEHSPAGKKARKKHTQAVANVRQHFLLMAGLGIDAAVMGHVSQPLKDRVGVLVVGASATRELPMHRSFSVEICAGDKVSL